MEQPKRVKYRKMQKDRRRGSAHSGNTLAFGEFGLQAMESAWVTSRQIEAARRTITHHFRRGGKVWIRIFPDKPITKKPAETRMGSGKGAPDHWVAVVKRGRMMFELGDVSEDLAKEAARLASHKLPLEVKFISKAAASPQSETTQKTGKEPQGEN
jgi:large subunit ribosomal protein L16